MKKKNNKTKYIYVVSDGADDIVYRDDEYNILLDAICDGEEVIRYKVVEETKMKLCTELKEV